MSGGIAGPRGGLRVESPQRADPAAVVTEALKVRKVFQLSGWAAQPLV